MIMAAMALMITLPAATTTLAQDDDIYFKKPTKKAIYQETENETWSTDANDDWDLDSYNRRGTELDEVVENDLADAAFYYEIPDGNGGVRKVAALSDSLKLAGLTDSLKVMGKKDYTKDIAPIHDTIFIVEQYAYCDRIRRFYNPYFGYYRYSPWYDIAYYDPFFWDYCYYDPWWYVSPSFGFHYGSWYWGWDYGYYTGWYGGWYCPYYDPYPHYYYPIYGGGGSYGGGGTGIRRGNGRRDGYHGSRNSTGSHIASRGGWRGDGGTRGASAGNNRSYRVAHTAGSTGTTTAGTNRVARRRSSANLNQNSNMRISPDEQTYRIKSNGIHDTGNAGNTGTSGRINRGTNTTTTTHVAGNNSTNRRADVGVHQNDRGEGISTNRGTTAVRHDGTGTNSRRGFSNGSSNSTYSNAGSSSRGSYSNGSYSGSSRSSYSGSSSSSSRSSSSYSGSSSTPARSSSSSSYSGGSSSSGGFSSGGGRSSGGGGSYSGGGGGGGRSGRR